MFLCYQRARMLAVMALHSLVVSCDPAVLQRVIPVFDLAGIDTEVCTRAEDAERRLSLQRYDATLIDCSSLPGAREVLDGVRRSGTNRLSVTFAIVSEITTPREAAALGASFVLEKNFTQDWLLRSLRAAQGLMVVENRRYYRHNVEMIAFVQRSGERDESAISVTDISQGGIGAVTPLPFQDKSQVELRFTLPGEEGPIDAQAQVVWAREGRLGLQFIRMSTKSKARLVNWLMMQYDQTQPSIPQIPVAISGSAERAMTPGRKLMCHAFAQNLPIAWKCNECGWRYSIRLDETRWRYANEPPQEVVLAFQDHDCDQHPKNGVVFGR